MRAALFLLLLWAGHARAQVDPDPWFAPDKALHFSFSAGLAGLGYGGAALMTEDRGLRVAVGAGLALSAGIAKELADLAGLGHPSWKDLAWDVAGTAVGLLVSWLLDRFIFTPIFSPSALVPRSAALHRPAPLIWASGEVEHAAMAGWRSDGCGGVAGGAAGVVVVD